MRAARMAWTVAGTWMAASGRAARYRPRSPVSTPVSTSVRTLSSRKKGLPPVRATSSSSSGPSSESSPRSACSSSSALARASVFNRRRV